MAKPSAKLVVLVEGELGRDPLQPAEEGQPEGTGFCTTSLIICKGINILIDPGSAEQLGLVKARLGRLRLRKAKKGLSLRDIDFVIFTHWHTDHAGSIDYFTEKEILVFDPKDERHYDFLPKPKKLITILSLPGHTEDHIAVLANNAEVSHYNAAKRKFVKDGRFEKAVIAGDTIISRSYFERNTAFPGAYSQNLAEVSMGKVARVADYIVPGHGPGFEPAEVKVQITVPEEADYRELIAEHAKIERDRDLDGDNGYFRYFEKGGIGLPKIEPGMRVLDLGCGNCRATLDMVQLACTRGKCVRPTCYRHNVPYHISSVHNAGDPRCNYIGHGKTCGTRIDFGRVIGVDMSEKSLREGEKYLTRSLEKMFPGKFAVITADDSGIQKSAITKKFDVPRDSDYIRTRLRELDALIGRRAIVLYQTTAEEVISIPNDYFDLILSVHMFEYVPDPIAAILNAVLSLKVGGKAYISGGASFYIHDEEISGEKKEALKDLVMHKHWWVRNACRMLKIEKPYHFPDFLGEQFSPGELEIERGRFLNCARIEKVNRISSRKILAVKEKFKKYYQIFHHNACVPFYVRA